MFNFLSIGNRYFDDVWCDVLYMDNCHLVLARPSQFDRNAMHNGRWKTYTFKKDWAKIVLGPMKDLAKLATKNVELLE